MGQGITRRTFAKAVAASSLLPLTGLCALRRRTNVVCILIDQLRKDAADLFLDRINRLAKRAIRFEQMRSVAPWTYPSVISFLSGLYPQQHQADGQLSSDRLSTFDRRVPLLQKTLRSAGYRTAAFVANPFLHKWNPFHEGFETYNISFINTTGNIRGSGKVWPAERMFANTVNPSIIEHFDRNPPHAPEFTYVHYMDVHGPWKGAPFTPDYESAVRYIDERIIEIYDYLMQRYDGEVLFFVTSDHGRALNDDLRQGYGEPWRKCKLSVHDFNLRIPFMVLPSNVVQGSEKVLLPCSNVDFVPTVLDWLGIVRRNRTPARSLMPAIWKQSACGEERALYAKVSAFGGLSDCIVFQAKKFVRFFNIKTAQVAARRVFDLRTDPQETTSLDGDFANGSTLLREAAGTHGLAYTARYERMSPEVEARLRGLGYLQ